MGLNADEKKLLQELTERDKEPEVDENYEIEIYDTSAGKGARVPYKTGKNWLHTVFGIGDAPSSAEGGAGEAGGAGGVAPDASPSDKDTKDNNGPGYFGRRA